MKNYKNYIISENLSEYQYDPGMLEILNKIPIDDLTICFSFLPLSLSSHPLRKTIKYEIYYIHKNELILIYDRFLEKIYISNELFDYALYDLEIYPDTIAGDTITYLMNNGILKKEKYCLDKYNLSSFYKNGNHYKDNIKKIFNL